MTIDERLEALTQSLELMASLQKDNDARIDGRIARLTSAIEEDGKHIRALVRIAEIHERPLTDLEGGQ
jgi:hypothetical protein